MAAPPAVNRRIIEALLGVELASATGHRLVLVHGSYEDPSAAEFTTEIAGVPRRIRVTDQPSVLGIVEAWQEHQEVTAGSDDVLVVTTGVDDAQLGWDLRGHAVHRSTRTVDRAEIVKHRFGAAEVDPRIRREDWLIDALLDAEPTSGWPRCGAVLTRDTAVRTLIEARLRAPALSDGGLDADALLDWSRTSAGPARFAMLSDAERAGLTRWLTETVGDGAPVLLGLAAVGRGADAIALGLVGSVLTGPAASAEAALSFGGLFGGLRFRPAELRSFTEVVEGTLERWVTEANSPALGSGNGGGARQRVLDVVERADELAAVADLTEVLAANRFLPSGFQARLRKVASALSTRPGAAAATAAETALRGLLEHCLATLYPQRLHAARMAVRLVRWLSTSDHAADSVAAGVRAHLSEWGWVDRALTVVWAGDPVGDPVVGLAYRTVYEAARARRDDLDETFAQHLAVWTRYASPHAPSGCLLVEQVLEQVALPLAAQRAPLVLLLDGMSSAVAAELGEQLIRRALIEVSPEEGHRAVAVSVLPSVTRVSRASLLTASLTIGDQSVEKDGFVAFWRKHRRDAALFHKGEIGGYAGHRLSESLIDALAGNGVVGVVLNTIDDALQHGREGDRTEWHLEDITYLPELLNAARGYGRPVVLVADHGHVLERSVMNLGPVAASGVESARWRTGVPEQGEVELAGPRVLYGHGRIVAPWREDIRYTHRRSGYHGGASLAEMTVPVLVLLPSAELVPSGWFVLPPESTVPAWWASRQTLEPIHPDVIAGAGSVGTPARRKTKALKQPEGVDGLFAVEDVTGIAPPSTAGDSPATVGARAVATEVYAAQRAFVRKAPDRPVVAAVIDALVAADGTLSLTAVANAAGRAGRNPDGFAATLQRLLNVEGYPVVGLADGGRTLKLDLELLRQQFGLGRP
ncbi:MAG: BREX-2 system phosphatase PglZ [Pseudonocardiales bacterium]|nr:MAG: BREX-2 system phosphatase PglZ [Pseudonocardiales bacterium]